jgi:hypothetical protein
MPRLLDYERSPEPTRRRRRRVRIIVLAYGIIIALILCGQPLWRLVHDGTSAGDVSLAIGIPIAFTCAFALVMWWAVRSIERL